MTRNRTKDSGEPIAATEARAAIREGMERAHELVSEAKLLMRQLGQGTESRAPDPAEPLAEPPLPQNPGPVAT